LYGSYKWQAFENSNKPVLDYNRAKIRVLPITSQRTIVHSANTRVTVTSLMRAIYISERGSVIGMGDFDFMLISPRVLSWSGKPESGLPTQKNRLDKVRRYRSFLKAFKPKLQNDCIEFGRRCITLGIFHSLSSLNRPYLKWHLKTTHFGDRIGSCS
jgi:hypothetical protein